MTSEPTIAGSTFLSTFKTLTELGIEEAVIEEQTGFTRQEIEDPDIRIPVSLWNRFLEKGVEWSGDPAFALHLGEEINHSRMGLVGHVVFNSRTTEEGIRHYIRFIKLANEGDRVELEEKGDKIAIVHTTEDPSLFSVPAIERNFSLAVTRLRRYTNENISPVRVEFQHGATDYTDEYERVFKAPVLFDMDQNRLVFHRSFLNLKIGKRSPHLHSGLVPYAERLMARLPQEKPVTSKARKWILESLSDGETGIETIAGKMFMSRQTLYRKLKKEGVSFTQLLDHSRKSMARKYLEQNEYSISEIAFYLGFSQISAFNRAFNRWYHINPSDFRRKKETM